MNNKSIIILSILIISMLMFLTGCKASLDPIMINNSEAHHNLDLREITHNYNRYKYNIKVSSIIIDYPNGINFTRIFNDGGDVDMWFKTSDIMDDNALRRLGYLTPDDIINNILAYHSDSTSVVDSSRSPLIGFGLVLLGVGIFLTPRILWMIKYGWHYKDSEPSETALLLQRASGVVVVIIGVFLF